MTCRHAPNDPACGGYKQRVKDAQALVAEDESRIAAARDGAQPTPNATEFKILRAEHVRNLHLILHIRYPSCAACAYEGEKILVFLDAMPLHAMQWRTIDPHFRDPKKLREDTEAPSPSARFPATDQGWADANTFADHAQLRAPEKTRKT